MQSRQKQHGVTLVELMVGMLVGLLATLVIAQVAKVYEAGKRNTTSGSDAQVNGAVALHTLQREIQAAGYGLSASGASGCLMKGRWTSTEYQWTLTPLLITNGTNGAPDSIRLLSSNKPNFSLPMNMRSDHLRQDSEFILGSATAGLTNVGNDAGDLIVAVPSPVVSGSICALSQISRVCTAVGGTCTSPSSLKHEVTDAPTNTNFSWNQDGTDSARTPFPGNTSASTSYPADSKIINLGTLSDRTFDIDNNSLRVTSFNSVVPASPLQQTLFSQIVNLQAVYGRDTSATPDNTPDVWDNTQPTNPGDWSRVVAVRLAIVSRSSQYEANVVTTVQPTWRPDGVTETTIKVNHLSDWQHYRYRVFESVVPLRNILWQS